MADKLGNVTDLLVKAGVPLSSFDTETKNQFVAAANEALASGLSAQDIASQMLPVFQRMGAGGAQQAVSSNIAGLGSAGDIMQLIAQANSPTGKFFTASDLARFGLDPASAQLAVMKQFGLNALGGLGGTGGDGSSWARLAFDRERAAQDDRYRAAQLALAQQEGQLGRESLAEKLRSGRVGEGLSARQNELAGLGQARGAYEGAGQLATSGFNAREQAIQGRGGLQARGAENLANLTNMLGNLGVQQQKLGLDILSTPRNAIPAFLMARGQAGAPGAGAFAPQNVLGFDPSQMQGLIQQAIQSAQGVGRDLPAMQDLDMTAIIQALSQLGDRAAAGNAWTAAGQPNVDLSAWGRLPSNQPSNPLVDSIIASLGGGNAYQQVLQGGSLPQGGGGLPAAPAASAPVARAPWPYPDDSMGAPRGAPVAPFDWSQVNPDEAMGAARPVPWPTGPYATA